MHNNNIIKYKRPQIKPLKTILPKDCFESINHPYERIPLKKTQTVQNQYSENFISVNPFQKKSIEKSLLAYGHESIHYPQRLYLDKKITSHDFNVKRSKQNSLPRYEEYDQNKKKNPYIQVYILCSQKDFDRRPNQNLLNKSNKIKSGSISKNLSPSLGLQPKSSLSNPYEGYKTNRKIVSVSRNQIKQELEQNSLIILLEQGKKYYKESKLQKAIESFKKVLTIKKMVQAQYLLAISYMNNQQYEKGINVFYQVITANPQYKKNVYLLTAIAYKKLNKPTSAIQILTKGINIFPQYYDCIMYRAKLYLKQNAYQKAIEDFNQAIKIMPTKGSPYIGKSDALKSIGKIQQAIAALNQAKNSDLQNVVLLKRAILLIEIKDFQNSLVDLEKCQLIDSGNSQIFYYKGIIQKNKGNYSQALLNFEQAIKKDNNENIATRSVEEILKIKISQKDFYEAYHVITRSQSMQINKAEIQDWKMYIEAALLLMKKKYNQGIELFSNLINNKFYGKTYHQHNIVPKQKYNFLKPLIHLYRAYGYFSLGNLKQAKADYQAYDSYFLDSKQIDTNHSKKYNNLLLKAIQEFPHGSKQYIQQASQQYPFKSQPYFYKALVLAQEYIQTENITLIQKVRENLDKSIQYLPQLSSNYISSIYYHRAVINLYSNQFEKAVADIDKAIQKSQDNIPKYFYLRGLIFACCTNYEQAIQDFTVSINLEQNFARTYLQRAKCLQLQENPNQAFLDLQKYITLRPEDPLIHKYAGFLLFQNSVYEDCLAAFSHGSQLIVDKQVLLTKAKCYFLLGKYNEAIQILQAYIRSFGETDYMNDIKLIKLIQNIQQNKDKERLNQGMQILTDMIQSKKSLGKFFQLIDIYVIRGGILTCLNDYLPAIENFSQAIKLRLNQKKQIYVSNNINQKLDEDEEKGWTILQINYCISVCYLAINQYKKALDIFEQVWTQQEAFSDEHWSSYKQLLELLINHQIQPNSNLNKKFQNLKLFHEERKLSNFLPLIQISFNVTQDTTQIIKIPLIFDYPSIESPQLLPQFDHQLLLEFQLAKIQPKPEAPWINRNSNGVVFTSNIQVFENLELSISDANKKNEVVFEEETIQIEEDLGRQYSFTNEQIKIEKKDLKDFLKLDTEIQKKLQKLMRKKLQQR